MKPVLLKFRCFGPYMHEQCIDFEALERNGLFLICGETGAGKTTILDAICYALYGRSSGGLRGDLSVMRCKLAQKDDETRVEFVFDNDGKRYKFVRSLKYGRKNLNDSHNCLVLEGEEYVPIFENPKATYVNQKAQELIGLTYEQFRQVIILPQGQFEKLLVSDSAEKEKILVSLFHADRWQKIAEEVYRRVAQQDGQLKQEKLQIAGKLREYGCETLPQLEEITAQQEAVLTRLKEETEEALRDVAQKRSRSEQAIADAIAFEELRRRENRLTELRSRERDFALEEAVLGNASAAEKIRGQYLACRDAAAKKQRALSLTAQAESGAQAAQQALAAAEEKCRRQDAAREAYERDKQQLLLLQNARELYRTLEEKRAAADRAGKVLAAAQKALETAEDTFALRDQQWQQAIVRQNRTIEEYRQIQERYLRGIGGKLARKLMPGMPCPVCGSREHPAPAPSTGDPVTQAQVEAKNSAMNGANDLVSAAMKLRAEAEDRKNQAAAACGEASRNEAVLRAEYTNAMSRRLAGIENEKQLESRILALLRQTAAFEQADVQLMQSRNHANNAAVAAEAKLDAAREELAAAQVLYAAAAAAWQEALERSGLENEAAFRASDMQPEEKQQRQIALVRFRTDLDRAQKELLEQEAALTGKTAPDMAAVKAMLEAAEKEYKGRSAEKILAENALERMRQDAKDLEKRTQNHDKLRRSVDADLDFANRLRGRSGVSLQRYVLGVMLTSITVEANRLLAKVYGGRYRLYRSDEIAGSGHKSGLELEIYDSQTNARRSVTTLSGGEKFLVALSLAIGLSAVVQAQGSGIRLEAMFIDEGFGSLDADAVQDALEVLQGIQRSSGVVGIISHVERLAETIPTRLEITKGRYGSTCRVCG